MVSGTNIKTLNNQSLLGSGNINTPINKSNVSGSLSIFGNGTTHSDAINIGAYSDAYDYSIALGYFATANADYSIALGHNATVSSSHTIQIGYGSGAGAYTFNVGFEGYGNYTLLTGTTGLIPDARISSNIARTSQIPTVPTNISAFTNDSGYITGITSSDVETALGYTPSDTDLSNLSSTGQAVIDGQWVSALGSIITSSTSLNGSTALPYTITALPDDGNSYEVLLRCNAQTDTSSGSMFRVECRSDLMDYSVFICGGQTRSNSYQEIAGSCIIPVSSTRTIYIARNSSFKGKIQTLTMVAYRRIGTNS